MADKSKKVWINALQAKNFRLKNPTCNIQFRECNNVVIKKKQIIIFRGGESMWSENVKIYKFDFRFCNQLMRLSLNSGNEN